MNRLSLYYIFVWFYDRSDVFLHIHYNSYTFLETDIDNKDIVCRLRAGEDKKYILFDDFKVYRDGKELGTISPGVLANAKTVEWRGYNEFTFIEKVLDKS